MNRRRFKEPVPKSYQVLDYLESTGTQYIDTGIEGSNILKTVIKYSYTSNVPAWLFGGRATSTITYGYIVNQSDQESASIRWNTQIIASPVYRGTHTITFGTPVYMDNTVIWSPPASSFKTGASVFLFAINDKGAANYYFVGKIHLCKLYQNDVLVRDLLPVRRISDGKLGLYDIINDVFYTNAGTGEFIAGNETGEWIIGKYPEVDCDAPGELGPDNPMKAKFIGYKKVSDFVPPEYIPVEYIQGDGLAYIDTNYYPTNKCKFEVKARREVGSGLVGSHAGNNYGYAVFPYSNLFGVYYGGTFMGWDTASSGKYDIYTKCDGKIFTIKLGDNPEYTKSVQGYSNSTYPLMLFGIRNWDTPEQMPPHNIGRNIIYSVKYWEEDKLVLDLVPCVRYSDGAVGFYNNGDKQYGEFLTNTSGRGNLISGTPITSDLVFVDRLWDYKRGLYNPTTGEFTKL